MAEYFSPDWEDITIAFPLNIMEIDAINLLAEKITLNLAIENVESVTFLSKHIKSKINVFLKIDVGYHRTGINPTNTKLINHIFDIIDTNPLISFIGFLGHAGHTYKCRTMAFSPRAAAKSSPGVSKILLSAPLFFNLILFDFI